MAKKKRKRVSKATPTKKKTARRKTSRKKTPRKRGGVNKSQAIRDYAAKHPSEGPTAIAKALAANGISVTPSFVSVVKSKATSGGSRSRGRRGPGRPSAATPTVEHLKAAKRFSDKVGGIPTARAALDALAEVMH